MSTDTPTTTSTSTHAHEENSDEADTEPDREPATVARSPDGEPRGVAVYLTAADLRKLGILPDGVEAVVPQIKNGAVLIKPVR
ncbi:hypothetical protein [Natrinema sp. DC36]|uniref:hypothetical protein n=1 Tax=Natrinema sp. DC36 TaxID=2878680 RepID=UPI001CF068E3|nr:hypothetical protein [Natrinema sp. DC36]